MASADSPARRPTLSGRLKAAVARSIDRYYGIETADQVRGQGFDDEQNVGYEPSGWQMLPAALRDLGIGPADVLLDLGCGKGRVVIQAATRFPLARVIGLERSAVLADCARRNVRQPRVQRRLRARSVEIVEADAVEWDVPDDVSVVYLYNPFRRDAFVRAMQRVIASYDRRPRPLRIVYLTAREHDALMGTGRVRELPPPRHPLLRIGARGTPPVRRYEIVPRPPSPHGSGTG